MKTTLSTLVLLTVLAGCSSEESPSNHSSTSGEDSPALTFRRFIETGHEIVFVDSAEAGPRVDSASFEFRFTTESTLTMREYGYGIDIVPGTYAIHESEMTVLFDGREGETWPTLTLSIEGDQFLLGRKDGLRSFKEHPNVWPEAAERIFPLRAKIPNERTKAAQLEIDPK